MSLYRRLLQEPSYGYTKENSLYIPSKKEVLFEVFSRLNPFDRFNWLTILTFCISFILISNLVIFFIFHFSWPLFAFIVLYTFFVMSSYANYWTHRYCVHKAYKFRNNIGRFICQNLVVRAVSEELHIISHHVHHQLPDVPGDPYNPAGGFLYCYLADFNHQNVSRNLDEKDFSIAKKMLSHTGIYLNNYDQYQFWGTVGHPRVILQFLLNWVIWFVIAYSLGGFAFVSALFGAAGFWTLSYRTLNYRVHSGGKSEEINWNRRVATAMNKKIPGIMAGEWHKNHHLFPSSAKCGFEKGQFDNAWLVIKSMHFIGIVESYIDKTNEYQKIKGNYS